MRACFCSLVLVPTPRVNLVREMDSPLASASDCEMVDPQTVAFSRKRGASVVLACEAKVYIEGLLVKVLPKL